MFVDDEDRILDGLRRSMHTMRAEWSMRFANSGPEALLQLAMEPADVVISDMQAIRFILSGHSESESIIRATRSAHRYLSKPCDAQALKVAIARAANLRTLLNNDALAAMVGSVDTLPTPPTAYMQLRDLLRDPEAAIADVVDVLQRDIGLTAKVVKLWFLWLPPTGSEYRACSLHRRYGCDLSVGARQRALRHPCTCEPWL
jgi:DNA-binding NtrC family response regulator